MQRSNETSEARVAPDSRAIVMTEVSELGGAERACIALSRWLYQQHIPNHLVTYQDTAGMQGAATHPVVVVQLRPKAKTTSRILALRSYLRSQPWQYPPLMSGYQAALHGTLAGGRGFHCLMHDTPSLFEHSAVAPSFLHRIYRRVSDEITGYGLRSGGRTIVTSEYLQRESKRVFRVRPDIARMGGLGDPRDFHERPVRDTLRMLSVSRIEDNKRIDWVLRTLARLEESSCPLSQQVNWHLDITGRGSQLQAMKTLTQSLGLEHRVTFHGFVSDETLSHLYNEADLFLMPAVQGYGIPAIESLQRGIPILLHRHSGVSDILLDTPWATVFEGGEDNMLPALRTAIDSVRHGRHLGTALPPIPSEDSWAERVAGLCGWLS